MSERHGVQEATPVSYTHLNHAKDQLDYTRLYAPISGYVQKRLFDSHETIRCV